MKQTFFQNILYRLSGLFRSAQTIPQEHQRNFLHLYLDIAWFGVLSGSTMSFLVIYATRLGADGQQVGLINAMPAVVTLLFAIPASSWLASRPIRSGVFWSALVSRLFYVLLIPLPVLLPPNGQIWTIILITLVMNIPGTGIAVGFNALFAEAVPMEFRGHVAGVRNAVLAVAATIVTLACGYILTHLPFSQAYQVVFGMGLIGAIMSTVHVGLVRVKEPARIAQVEAPERDAKRPIQTFLSNTLRSFRPDVVRGPFRRTILLLFLFHFGQYLAIPVFPLFTVNELQFSDQVLSLGSSLFNVSTFVGSMYLSRVIRRMGNQKVMGMGVMMLGLYPGIISLTRGVGMYALASLVGGMAWALAGGVLYNYLLEKVPDNDRPAYLAWYTLALNAAILMGSMIGPAVAGQIGMASGLAVFAVVRMMAGTAILKWG